MQSQKELAEPICLPHSVNICISFALGNYCHFGITIIILPPTQELAFFNVPTKDLLIGTNISSPSA